MITFGSEQALAAAAIRLHAASVPGWSAAEQRLAEDASQTGLTSDVTPAELASPASGLLAGGPGGLARVHAEIMAGEDPLGEAFCQLRPPARRRVSGQVLTPAAVVRSMVSWAASTVDPVRVVDPGTGSGRFLAAAGRRWPAAALIGVETDPLAALIGRASLAAAGLAGRARIVLGDYRSLRLPPASGPTLFLGNPPYVRHHHIPPQWKAWLRTTAASQGLPASGLAGLHAHFFLATALHAVPGDAGVLVTAAEWLDVNYGALVRSLLLGPLGGQAVHLLDPTVPVFADAAATSAICCFLPGSRPSAVRLSWVPRPADLRDLPGGRAVPVRVLRAASRWSPLVTCRTARRQPRQAGYVELGELCRVHRGQVTGANRIWITAGNPACLPARFLFPAVTRASELFSAPGALTSTAALRSVIDLPADLAELPAAEYALVTRFLAGAEAAGAAGSYVACHRRPWWRVRLGPPAPILASYMARRPPAFVRNLAGVRHVNVAHGIYPRDSLPPAALDGLAAFLRQSVTPAQGRTYAGGLTKFEPGEMERLRVPGPDLLFAHRAAAGSDPAAVPHPGQPLTVGDDLRGENGI